MDAAMQSYLHWCRTDHASKNVGHHRCGVSAKSGVYVAQAGSALEEDRDEGAEAKGQNHLWDFILDGTNMLIRSATLQVCPISAAPLCHMHRYCSCSEALCMHAKGLQRTIE